MVAAMVVASSCQGARHGGAAADAIAGPSSLSWRWWFADAIAAAALLLSWWW